MKSCLMKEPSTTKRIPRNQVQESPQSHRSFPPLPRPSFVTSSFHGTDTRTHITFLVEVLFGQIHLLDRIVAPTERRHANEITRMRSSPLPFMLAHLPLWYVAITELRRRWRDRAVRRYPSVILKRSLISSSTFRIDDIMSTMRSTLNRELGADEISAYDPFLCSPFL